MVGGVFLDKVASAPTSGGGGGCSRRAESPHGAVHRNESRARNSKGRRCPKGLEGSLFPRVVGHYCDAVTSPLCALGSSSVKWGAGDPAVLVRSFEN